MTTTTSPTPSTPSLARRSHEPPAFADLLRRTREYVRGEMSGNDPSHDMDHVERVVAMTHSLASDTAAGEGWTDLQLLTMTLAALLHDVRDFKYSAQEGAAEGCARDFLQREIAVDGQHVPHERDKQRVIRQVAFILRHVSFKDELGKHQHQHQHQEDDACVRMLHCVQDSDRLDALGAIGIARCMAFSGARNRALYHPDNAHMLHCMKAQDGKLPTKEEYMAMGSGTGDPKMGTAIGHFFVKLFHLKDLMKTPCGKALAEQRTAHMRQFVEQFTSEWNQER